MRNIFLIFIYFISFNSVAWAASKFQDVREGKKLYQAEKYKESSEKYAQALGKDSESDIINFGLGTAYYKNNQFDRAVEHLQKSLLTNNPLLKQKSYYNLGNAFYKHGMSQEQENLKEAVHAVEQSIAQYDKALSLNEKDEDAKFNRDYAAKELERLKKKLQEQKEQEQNNQQQNQSEKQDQDKKDQKEKEQSQKNQGQSQDQQNQQNPDQNKNNSQNAPSQEKQDKASGQERQQGRGGSKDQKENASQGRPNESADDEKGKAAGEEQALTQKEAQRTLDEYIQVEEPRSLFNPLMNSGVPRDVDKDW